jgi:2',3'-cyclic-nucleotide 2'-phosphodiesterase / 3'-nucleotidase
MGDYIAYERGMQPGDMHPIIAAMNTLGFDASTLGNHEFNYGLDFMMKVARRRRFPHRLRQRGRGTRRDARARTTLCRPTSSSTATVTDGAGESIRSASA